MTYPNDPIKPMNIHNIRIDGDTQSRVAINQEAVTEYAAVLADGDNLPPVIVFFDGVDYWLADGFHRYHAHLSAGRASISAKIKKGTRRDATLFGFSANNEHGLRPTNADKQKSVRTMLADPEWSELSDRAIARTCGCSRMTVARIRTPEVIESVTSDTSTPDTSVTSDTKPEATKPASSVTSDSDAPEKQTPAQAHSAQIAQDAHGESDPIELLVEAEQKITELQKELFALQADDQKAETLKYKRLADIATRRQNELMDTVNAREKELQRQANWLRRIGNALGEDDNAKLPALVEAMARSAKVVA